MQTTSKWRAHTDNCKVILVGSTALWLDLKPTVVRNAYRGLHRMALLKCGSKGANYSRWYISDDRFFDSDTCCIPQYTTSSVGYGRKATEQIYWCSRPCCPAIRRMTCCPCCTTKRTHFSVRLSMSFIALLADRLRVCVNKTYFYSFDTKRNLYEIGFSMGLPWSYWSNGSNIHNFRRSFAASGFSNMTHLGNSRIDGSISKLLRIFVQYVASWKSWRNLIRTSEYWELREGCYDMILW